MNNSRLVRAACLVIGIGLAAAATGDTATAAVRPSAVAPTTVVVRGATADPAKSSGSGNDQSGVTVLRGSPPPAQPPAAQYACPEGYAYEPGYGCVPPSEPHPVYEPYVDFGYWPYDYYGYWHYFAFVEGSHRAFRHGFAAFRHRAFRHRFTEGRRPAFRPGFAHAPRIGLAPGFAIAHGAVGFAHGFGGIGGLGHR